MLVRVIYFINREKRYAMVTTKIGVASRSAIMSNSIKAFLELQSNYEIVWIAANEDDAFKFFRENQVNCLIWDIIEPISFKDSCLYYIINTNLDSPLVVLASDVCLKDNGRLYSDTSNVVIPFDFSAIDQSIELFKELGAGNGIQTNSISEFTKPILNKPEDLEMNITNMIHILGIPPHLKGYHYLRYGISLVINNMGIIGSVTKELYPRIAEKYNTTSSRVERDIRHAISLAWGRNVDNDTVKAMFNSSAKKRKPTNSEFIAKVADRLRLESHGTKYM